MASEVLRAYFISGGREYEKRENNRSFSAAWRGRKQNHYFKDDRAEFLKAVQETQAEQQAADITKKTRRLAMAQKRVGDPEKPICKIYEDDALGRLPGARYAVLDAQYAKEQGELFGEIAGLEKAIWRGRPNPGVTG